MIEHACGQRNAQAVVEKGPEQILFDVADNCFAQLNGGDYIQQIIFHQHDIGAFQSNIGAGTDGQANIGPGQSRRIVDAVAHHGHGFALTL